MKTILDIAPLVRYIEIFEDTVVVHADSENLELIGEYLHYDRALNEIEENKMILRIDPEKEPKFRFVHQRALILRDHIKEKRIGIGVPPDILSTIVGHDNIKTLIIRSIGAKKPVHILLYGPPSTAKSLFMCELERLPGAILVLGGELTRAGLTNIIAAHKPRFLLIDELDKIRNSSDISSLLSWMEHGRIIIGKYKDYRVVKDGGWVFAACNKINKFPVEFLSRFLKIRLNEYSREELKSVMLNVLLRENVRVDLAVHIANKLMEMGYADVRDAVRVGRLASTKEDVDEVVAILRERV